jgi:hypothetical protein
VHHHLTRLGHESLAPSRRSRPVNRAPDPTGSTTIRRRWRIDRRDRWKFASSRRSRPFNSQQQVTVTQQVPSW